MGSGSQILVPSSFAGVRSWAVIRSLEDDLPTASEELFPVRLAPARNCEMWLVESGCAGSPDHRSLRALARQLASAVAVVTLL